MSILAQPYAGTRYRVGSSQYTVEYEHISAALKSRWPLFCSLTEEINNFVPRPLSDFEAERAELLADRTELLARSGLIPDSSDEESIAKFVDSKISILASERFQAQERFSNRFMTEYVTVTLLSHALCEATINAILAVGLSSAGSQAIFSLIERADIKEKWCIAPKCLFPSYELPRHSALFETLNHLTRHRNSLVHQKIQLHMDGKKVFDGSKLERQSFTEGISWLKRYFSLPYDLSDYVRLQIPRPEILLIFLDRSPIEAATAHKMPNLLLEQTDIDKPAPAV